MIHNGSVTKYEKSAQIETYVSSVKKHQSAIETYEDRIDKNIMLLYQLEKDFSEKLNNVIDGVDNLISFARDVPKPVLTKLKILPHQAEAKLTQFRDMEKTVQTTVESFNAYISEINGQLKSLKDIVITSDDLAKQLRTLVEGIHNHIAQIPNSTVDERLGSLSMEAASLHNLVQESLCPWIKYFYDYIQRKDSGGLEIIRKKIKGINMRSKYTPQLWKFVDKYQSKVSDKA